MKGRKLIQSNEDYPAIKNISKIIAIDTENIGYAPEGYSIAWRKVVKGKVKTFSFYVPIKHKYPIGSKLHNVDWEFAKSYMQQLVKGRRCIFHNSAYDLTILKVAYDIEIPDDKIEDTMLAHWVLDTERAHGLKDIMYDEYGKQVIKYKEAKNLGIKAFTKYGEDDARYTLRLYFDLLSQFREKPKQFELYKKYELPYIRLLQQMNYFNNMMRIDKALLGGYYDMMDDEMNQIVLLLKKQLGEINFNSNPQLGSALEKVGYKVKKNAKTNNYMLAERELQNLFNKQGGLVLDVLLYNRHLVKIYTTYVSKFYDMLEEVDKDVWVISGYKFLQHGTRTGRMSSSEPNMQQMPRDPLILKQVLLKKIKNSPFKELVKKFRKISYLTDDHIEYIKELSKQNKYVAKLIDKCSVDMRKIFIPMPGKVFVGADYSQLELRMMAHLSGDKEMLDAYNRGVDFHQETADGINKIVNQNIMNRQDAKCIHPEMLLRGNNSFIKMNSLSFGEEKCFKHVKNNLFVETESYISQQVTQTYNNGEGDGYVIVSTKGVLICSEKHRVLLKDGKLKSIIEGLSKGDEIKEHVLYKPRPSVDSIPIKLKDMPETRLPISTDMMYVLGMFLGDGTCSESSIAITFGNNKKRDCQGRLYSEWIKQVKDSLKKIKLRPRKIREEDERSMRVDFGSRKTIDFFEQLGVVKDSSKYYGIPEWVFNTTVENIYSFISGLVDTDGSINKYGQLQITTKSEVLASHLGVLLNSLSFQYSIEPIFNKTYERWYYRFSIYSGDVIKLKPFMRNKSKVERLKNAVYPSRIRGNVVRQIIPIGKIPLVDITIDSDKHLYWTSNFITHNTTNFFFQYGGYYKTLAGNLGIDVNVAKQIDIAYNQKFKMRARFIRDTHQSARKSHYVQTILGRRRNINTLGINENPNDHSLSKEERKRAFMRKNNAENASISTVISGSSADLIKVAMLNLFNKYPEVEQKLQVHDELLIEVPEKNKDKYLKIIKEEMENAMKLKVKIEAEAQLGYNWREVH